MPVIAEILCSAGVHYAFEAAQQHPLGDAAVVLE
jgi:hypothetical protein